MKQGSTFGASLLVAGTAIGGGILAMPVLTGLGGFFPAIIMYIACWLFMAQTGLLLMEVYLWSPSEVNIVSMAHMTLGRPGKVIAWILYLFLFYSLTVAYVSGGGDLLKAIFPIPAWFAPWLFVLIFAPFVIIGPWIVDRLNWVLMAGLILTFCTFAVIGVRKVDLDLLTYVNWSNALLAMPVIFTSFGFQGLVPTLTNYLQRDPRAVRKAILWGSAIPLFVYIIWEALILGIIPLRGLELAKQLGQSAVAPLKDTLHLPLLYPVGQFFAFFALLTSFLGVSLALIDFLVDGFNMSKRFKNRFVISLLVFIPPAIFSMTNPCIFLNALHYAGGFGCALLLGLLPILMVWAGHKKFGSQTSFLKLGIMLLFIFFELTVMVLKSIL